MESMKAEVNTLKSILDLHIKEKKNVNLKSQEIQLYDKLTEDLVCDISSYPLILNLLESILT